ncbi:MAG: hypothetical protein CVV44_15260 [Spirochaetae bacterium HGW-Spirochaetae-1]|jgi:hypothetical protein|nr:MAG: hypothetical protein CVV44_15260 [Spirochaetae bacterium HGW-Spirochaetae-1]
MNPVQKIFGQLFGTIGSLINGMNSRTVKSVQQAFYFFIFMLAMVGIILGYMKGQNAARIQSPPLASTVNETFEYDISREKNDGDFTGTLESSLISESKYSEPDKVKFPTQEKLEPEYREEILENRHGRMSGMPQINPLEGDYRPSPDDISDVRMLDKTENSVDKEKAQTVDLKPLEREDGKIKEKEKSTVRIIRDRAGTRSADGSGKDSTAPAPMEKTSDIFEK